MRTAALTLSVASLCLATALEAKDKQQAPLVESYLQQGKLKDGEQALTAHLARRPDDDQARFGLGALQFLRAVESLGQALHHYGARQQTDSFVLGGGAGIPIFRLPVPHNPHPAEIRYRDARRILKELLANLSTADKTLAQISDPQVTLPLHFGLIRLDLDGDGHADEQEKLWRVYARIMNRNAARSLTREPAEQFTITFDKADVHWLRGYCHLISALAEIGLAHDWQRLFETTGQMIFAKVKSKQPPIIASQRQNDFIGRILDEVAFVHLVRLPVRQPQRLLAARDHLRVVIAQSRLTWQAIAKETDDNREWIPGPHQAGVVPGIRVTAEMVAGWKQFLDEAELILEGKKLIPFWRGDQQLGVNLNRAFSEPREFDLVLWLQGSAASPFLEQGEISSPATWNRFQTIFRGQFIGFVIWFN